MFVNIECTLQVLLNIAPKANVNPTDNTQARVWNNRNINVMY